MAPFGMEQAITISVPARTGFVHVLRAVTAGVAARLDFSVDDIDDLRLAVDEASAHLLSQHPSLTRLSVRLTPGPDRFEVLAWGDGQIDAWPKDDTTRSMAWHVLVALTDELSLERVDGEPAIRFAKRLPERSA